MTTTAPTVETNAAEAFANDVTNHTMTVLHDDGLYRHLRFQADRSFDGFDLITWPGTLAIKGGHGGHIFSREVDMLAFFRATRYGSINAGYWAEKLAGGRDSVKQYSEAKFVELVTEALDDYEERFPELEQQYKLKVNQRGNVMAGRAPTPPAEVRRELADAREDGDTGSEDLARALLRSWETDGVVSDVWEWDLSDWDFHYLWCCHAIRWGVAKYDAARVINTPALV